MKNICKIIKKHKEDKEIIKKLNEQVSSLTGWIDSLNSDKERYEAKLAFQETKIYDLKHELERTKALLINIRNEGTMDENSSASITARIGELSAVIDKGYYQL